MCISIIFLIRIINLLLCYIIKRKENKNKRKRLSVLGKTSTKIVYKISLKFIFISVDKMHEYKWLKYQQIKYKIKIKYDIFMQIICI